MANISEIIEKFTNAIYGKDVRQSMVDLANAVNSEAASAMETAKNASTEIKQSVQDTKDVITKANDTIKSTTTAKETAEAINAQSAALYERLKNTDVSTLQDKVVPVNITNLTINIDDYNYAKGYEVGKWKCISTSGAANITGLPGNKDSFLLTLDTPRANNILDYVQMQTVYYAYNKTIYQRWCTNGVYSAWVLMLNVDTAKTVLGIQPGTTADITYNIPIADLKATIESLPKKINHTITINVSAGTTSNVLTLNQLDGTGTLIITGATTESAYTHNVPNVIITNNSLKIIIAGVTATSTAVTESFKIQENTGLIQLQNCNTVVTATSVNGFFAQYNPGLVTCTGCVTTNKNNAYYSAYGSRIYVVSGTGTGNITVYRAYRGGEIRHIYANTITGTTIYSKAQGGTNIDYNGASQ